MVKNQGLVLRVVTNLEVLILEAQLRQLSLEDDLFSYLWVDGNVDKPGLLSDLLIVESPRAEPNRILIDDDELSSQPPRDLLIGLALASIGLIAAPFEQEDKGARR